MTTYCSSYLSLAGLLFLLEVITMSLTIFLYNQFLDKILITSVNTLFKVYENEIKFIHQKKQISSSNVNFSDYTTFCL